MKLIISSITCERAYSKVSELEKELLPKFEAVFNDVEYSAFESFCIIPVILTDEYFKGNKERVLRQHKSRSADVRLRIPYEAFCNARFEKRREIYIDHLVMSVLALESRMKNKSELMELKNIADRINRVR